MYNCRKTTQRTGLCYEMFSDYGDTINLQVAVTAVWPYLTNIQTVSYGHSWGLNCY